YIFGFGNRDGEAVAQVHVQHDVQIGAAVAGINDVIRADLEIALQLVECGDLAVTGGGAHDGLDVPAVAVAKLGAKNVVERNNPFQGGLDDLDGSSREHVKIETVAVNPLSQDLIEQLNILLQADTLADLVQVLYQILAKGIDGYRFDLDRKSTRLNSCHT